MNKTFQLDIILDEELIFLPHNSASEK